MMLEEDAKNETELTGENILAWAEAIAAADHILEPTLLFHNLCIKFPQVKETLPSFFWINGLILFIQEADIICYKRTNAICIYNL